MVDVLADIKKATNFIDNLVAKETPKQAAGQKILALNADD